MRVFSHGSNVNFQTSTREMFFPDLQALIRAQQQIAGQFVAGLLKPESTQLAVHGMLKDIDFAEDSHRFTAVDGESISYDPEQFILSQEAVFTIEDEREGRIDFTVIYLTYEEDDAETVVFFVDEAAVTHPLACVVQFYEQVKEVGRDVDFAMVGCSAHEWKPEQN